MLKVRADHTKPTQDSSSALLTLPAELRNKIYDYALVEPDKIIVDEDLKLPGLLFTCRQTLQESLGIYYGNAFFLKIKDCNMRLLTAFHKHKGNLAGIANVDLPPFLIWMRKQGVDWANLEDWCHSVWKRDLLASTGHWRTDNDHKVIIAAHQIALNSGSWESCKKQLDALRMVAGALNPKWLQ